METQREFNKDRAYIGVLTESSGEYLLPDYNGDVKRLLTTKARAIPSGKFLSGDNAEFAGIVAYDVVYLDSENNLTKACFTTDYDLVLKCSGEDYEDAGITTRVATYGIRLIGPRKISAKATLSSDVHISEHSSLDISGDAFLEEEPEIGTEMASIRCSKFLRSEEKEYAEELARIEGGIADDVDVLLCNAQADVDEITRSEGRVGIKGNLVIKALVKNGDGVPYKVGIELPVDESVEADGVDADCGISASVIISSVRPEVNPTEEGVVITVSVICECEFHLQSNCTVPIITDSYIKTRGCENGFSDFSYTTFLSEVHSEEKMSADLSRQSLEMENVRDVITVEATPTVESVEGCDGGVLIKGNLRYSGIACEINEDGTVGYTGFKFTVPFGKTVNNCLQYKPGMRYEVNACVRSVSCELDAGAVYPSANLAFCVTTLSEGKIRRLATSHLTDEVFEPDPATVTVYYPESGESLFDIAKKYHTSVMTIAKDNSLTEGVMASPTSKESLVGIKRLLIR